MKKRPLPYLHPYTDRHGKLRIYFRKAGRPLVPLPGEPNSLEFMQAYTAALAGELAPAAPVGADRVLRGTMKALAVQYFQSAEFRGLALSTQATYRGIIERFLAKHGDKPVARLEARHIRAMLDKQADTPAAANNLLRMLRILMRFAVERGWRTDDPTPTVRKVRSKSEGFHTWTDDEISRFRAFYPIGTRERLAFELLRHTGQRRSDVVRLGPQHLRDNLLTLTQQKTRVKLTIPLHPELQAVLDASEISNLAFLVTKHGKPFSPAGFTNWFRDITTKAGLPPRCTPHGLRKANARLAAEAGGTFHEIASITGHKTHKEVERYTREVAQKTLAEGMVAKLQGNGKGTPIG